MEEINNELSLLMGRAYKLIKKFNVPLRVALNAVFAVENLKLDVQLFDTSVKIRKIKKALADD